MALFADPSALLSTAPANVEVAPPRLRECGDCGLFQVVPALGPASAARSLRCDAVMRRTRRDPLGRALALNIAALSLFGVACLMSLMTVSTAGMQGRRPPNTRSVRFAVPPPTPDLTGEVSAMSTAVGQLADAVAAMLRRQEQDDVIKSLRRF